MPAERRYTERVEIGFDSVELKEIDRIADRWHLTRSQLIRDAVAAYVEGTQNEERRKLQTTYRRALLVLNLEADEEAGK